MSIYANNNPPMTRHLVEAGLFRDDPVVIVDVGARWGYNREWRIFGDALRVICFEPDAVECARLNATAEPGVTYVPSALGREAGTATLYVAKLSASTGLYKTDMSYFSRLLNGANGETAGEERVQVVTLDQALRDAGIGQIDFIKLDAEGAELDVLQGAPRTMASSRLLGMLSEIRFQPEINGCPTFSALDQHLQPLGFRLFGMQFTHQSRRALPYPSRSDYRLPNGERFFAYTTHGQVMDGDALYFRDLLIPANAAVRQQAGPTQVLKAAALFEIYSLGDCAAELILASRALLDPVLNCDDLLDRLTPPIGSRRVGFREYLDAYFDPDHGVFES
jgi:FkbM family methyltransferase